MMKRYYETSLIGVTLYFVFFHLGEQSAESFFDLGSVFCSGKDNFTRTEKENSLDWLFHFVNRPRETIIFNCKLVFRQLPNINFVAKVSIGNNIGDFKVSEFNFFICQFLNFFDGFLGSNLSFLLWLWSYDDHFPRFEDKDGAFRFCLSQNNGWESFFVVSGTWNLLSYQFQLQFPSLWKQLGKRDNILHSWWGLSLTHFILIDNSLVKWMH